MIVQKQKRRIWAPCIQERTFRWENLYLHCLPTPDLPPVRIAGRSAEQERLLWQPAGEPESAIESNIGHGLRTRLGRFHWDLSTTRPLLARTEVDFRSNCGPIPGSHQVGHATVFRKQEAKDVATETEIRLRIPENSHHATESYR